MDPWLKHAISVLDNADTQEKYPPFKHKAFARWTASICLPICCAPCVVWSCLGRVVACPFQYFLNGFADICNSNACTVCTDSSIRAYTDLTHEHAKLKKLPSHAVFDANDEDKERFLAVLGRIERIFMGTQDIRIKYAIAEAFVAPIIDREVTPSQVLAELRQVRNRVFSDTLSKNHGSASSSKAVASSSEIEEDATVAAGAAGAAGFAAEYEGVPAECEEGSGGIKSKDEYKSPSDAAAANE